MIFVHFWMSIDIFCQLGAMFSTTFLVFFANFFVVGGFHLFFEGEVSWHVYRCLVPIEKSRYESLWLVTKTPTKLRSLGGVFILGNTPAVF